MKYEYWRIQRQKKMPSGVGKRHLGLQQMYGHPAAASNYIKNRKVLSKHIPSPTDFYLSEIAELKEYAGDWAWGLCPFHDDHSPSLTVNLDTGYYKCHSSSCGVHGNSIVSFVMQRMELAREDAVQYLKEWAWTRS